MLTINIPKIDQPPKGPAAIVADRRVYLALDERTLVEDGDGSARFLLAAAGSSIPGPDVGRLNLSLVDGRVVQDAPALTEAEKVEATDATEKVEATPSPEKTEAPVDAEKADATDAKPAGGKREKK